MQTPKKPFFTFGFSDGHPHQYHLVAVALAVIAMNIAVTTRIFAEEFTNSSIQSIEDTINTNITDTTIVSCSYSYSNWSTCTSEGKKYRTVTGKTPSGCEETTKPDTSDSCEYTAPNTTTFCSYSYSSWGECKPEGKKYRTITGKTPSGCVETTKYVVESCQYTSVSTDTADAVQCVYAYSDWKACQPDGKRFRTLISKSPTGCVEYVHPVFVQSCVYDDATITTTTSTESVSTSTNTTSTTTDSNNTTSVTPTFSFVNVGDGMTVRGEFDIKGTVNGAQRVEYYLVPSGSNIYKYIGTAQAVSGSEWLLRFRSKEFPNGEFYLRAKIKNTYGEYGGGQRKIRIANEYPTTVASSESSGSSDTGEGSAVNNEEIVQTLKQFEQDIQITQETQATTETETPNQTRKRIFNYCQENPAKCFPERDTDKDGLSDIDEIRYGTNPKSADSDLDGYIDGDEVENGFDPVKYSSGDLSDKIVFEDPKSAGEVKTETYVVEDVTIIDTKTGGKGLQLTGKGLPNSFVTIYIYSDPIVLTVKTDSDGNWTYELDKALDDGEHQVYVAVTDNTGKITAKSAPLAFVKTAEAATVIPVADAREEARTPSVAQNRSVKDFFFLAAIVIAALAVALATIGLIKHKSSTITPSTPSL